MPINGIQDGLAVHQRLKPIEGRMPMFVDHQFSALGAVPSFRALKTLVLDDCRFDRSRLRRLCRETSLILDVHEVASIEQFEHALHMQAYDLFLIDYKLTLGTGLDALAAVRRDRKCAAAATIMISGGIKADIKADAVNLGCDGFLAKQTICHNRLQNMIQDVVFDAQYEHHLERKHTLGSVDPV